MRKALFIVLILAMVSSFGVVAFATTSTVRAPVFSDIVGTTGEWELAALGALGVFTGDTGLGGTVRPADPITRAEFCKVVVTAMGKGGLAVGLAGLVPSFTDATSIQAWAVGYVNAAAMMGIIHGYSDGSFGPNKSVTSAEAITMLVRAVAGHDAQVGAGVWPGNYLWYGLDNDFVGEADISATNSPCTRGNMAIMVFNTMNVQPLNADGDPSETADPALDLDRVHEGTLTNYNLASNSVTIGTVLPTHTLAGTVNLAIAANMEGLRTLPVLAITGTHAAGTEDKVIFIGPKEGTSAAFTGPWYQDDFVPASDTTGLIYLRFRDGTLIPYDTQANHATEGFVLPLVDSAKHVAVTINGVAGSDERSATLAGYDECVVTKDENGFATNMAVKHDYDWYGGAWSVNRFWVTNVIPAATDAAFTTVSGLWFGAAVLPAGISIPVTCPVTINGAAGARNSLAKWDVVYVGFTNDTPNSQASNLAYVDVIRTTVSGTVTNFTAVTYPTYTDYVATINGTNYSCDLETNPEIGYVVTYGLDRDDYAYAPISGLVPTDYWWFKSWTDNAEPADDIITVDIGGSEGPQSCAPSVYTPAGTELSHVGKATVVGGHVTAFAPLVDLAAFRGPYHVVAVDPASGYLIFNVSEVLHTDAAVGVAIYMQKATWHGDHVVPEWIADGASVASWCGLGGILLTDHIYISKAPHADLVVLVANRNLLLP